MIVCPNCNHHNPEGAQQCEACYTPLPEMTPCPHCGAPVQADANFCGQCGADLRSNADLILPTALEAGDSTPANAAFSNHRAAVPDFDPTTFDPAEFAAEAEFTAELDSLGLNPQPASSAKASPRTAAPPPRPLPPPPPPLATTEPPTNQPLWEPTVSPTTTTHSDDDDHAAVTEAVDPDAAITEATLANAAPASRQATTQLQMSRAQLVHLRSDSTIDLPGHFSVLHLGKPNDRVPPDIDLSGYADAEVVSRVHADIRLEGDAYFLEDVGSANGTYVNNQPLLRGNRHRLRSGDRISLGKGDLVAFVFHLA